MPTPQDVKDAVFERAGGRCECRRAIHLHISRCSNPLEGRWQVHQPVPESIVGLDLLYNFQGLCSECYEKVSHHASSQRQARGHSVEMSVSP